MKAVATSTVMSSNVPWTTTQILDASGISVGEIEVVHCQDIN